jgi:hypothetical protein
MKRIYIKKEIIKMENTMQVNPKSVTVPRSAFFIEKVHRCAECPIRRLAIKQPRSIFARVHAWHKNWWPGWKAQQARACVFNGKA